MGCFWTPAGKTSGQSPHLISTPCVQLAPPLNSRISPLSQSPRTAAGYGSSHACFPAPVSFWKTSKVINPLSGTYAEVCGRLLVLSKCCFCSSFTSFASTMREIVHIQAGQCGNQIGAKVRKQSIENVFIDVK